MDVQSRLMPPNIRWQEIVLLIKLTGFPKHEFSQMYPESPVCARPSANANEFQTSINIDAKMFAEIPKLQTI